jgi:hypothetical protein
LSSAGVDIYRPARLLFELVAYATFHEVGICQHLVNGGGENYFCGGLAHLPGPFQQVLSGLAPRIAQQDRALEAMRFVGDVPARSGHE